MPPEISTQPREQQRLLLLIDSERNMLEMLANGHSLTEVLDAFARSFEVAFDGMMCSILLMEGQGKRLRHGAGPSLPAAYWQAVDGLEIGMGRGSCAASAYTGQETLVSDIATDPLWSPDVRALALGNGVRSCWSIPVLSIRRQVLGTFAIHNHEPRVPTSSELHAIRRGAYMVGLAIEHDRSEKRLLAGQASLRESALRTQAILDNMADGVITIDSGGLIQSCNKAATEIFGHPVEVLLGRNISMLVPEPHGHRHDSYLENYRRTGQARIMGKAREVVGLRSNGEVFPLSLSVTELKHNDTSTFIGIVRDITQHRKDEDEIRRLAFYDPLTELPNRRLLMDRLKQAMVTSARTGQHGAVMFLDLDHFKLLNDNLGHDIGDELLKQVATRLRSSVREGDSVARLGGDEFVVLLEALSEHPSEAAAQAETIANKILAALGQPYTLSGHAHDSTPSIGIVMFMQDHETMDDLLKKADLAMYQAKAAGRNTARFFDPAMQAAVAAHSEIERALRIGLVRREFELHYQVQVGRGGAIIGAEALVRWRRPEFGMVPPGKFIAVAEATGLILPLGQWVLETACRQLVAWAADPVTAAWTVSVNVSASQFAQDDFERNVAKALQGTGANPRRLKLELTESMLVKDVDGIIVKMNAIKATGVGFSLDDFGTGFSSLSYLKRMPLDQLKIDQTFVSGILTDKSDTVISRTIITLGHSMGMTVIAEGVETAEHRQRLADMNCDAFQGYHFGRPCPAEQLEPSAKF